MRHWLLLLSCRPVYLPVRNIIMLGCQYSVVYRFFRREHRTLSQFKQRFVAIDILLQMFRGDGVYAGSWLTVACS
jgi:hypothetical protein